MQKLLKTWLMVALPASVALWGGIWITQQVAQKPAPEAGFQVDPKRHLSVEAQLLREMVQEEIQNIRLQAVLLANSSSALPSGAILHWAQYSAEKSAQKSPEKSPEKSNEKALLRKVRNPAWKVSEDVERQYLKAAIQQIDLKQLAAKGVGLFRMKRDVQGGSEWLALAFPNTTLRPSVLLVLVDPVQAFPVFQRWNFHSQGGRFRSYLLAEDGRVLTHSQKSWISADFSHLPFFREQVKKVLDGVWLGGQGEARSMDRTPVSVAFFRLGELPLALVVEEVKSTLPTTSLTGAWIQYGLFIGLILISLSLLCAWILRRFLVEIVTIPVYSGVNPLEPVASPLPGLGTPIQQPEKKSPDRRFFSKEDMLILDPTQESSEADL